jgi:hypothetical protein
MFRLISFSGAPILKITFGQTLKYPVEPLEFSLAGGEPTDAVQSYLTFLKTFGFGDMGENNSNSISYPRYLDDFCIIW